MIVALVLGLVIGALVGLLGGGGSILAVPALVYAAGQSLPQAIATSLLVVGITAVVALLPRLRTGQVAWRIADPVRRGRRRHRVRRSGGQPAPPGRRGARPLRRADDRRRDADAAGEADPGAACAVDGGPVNWRRCLPRTLAGGLVVGFLTGLLGVGGGFLIIPVLVLVLGLPMTTAIGTSLVIVAVNSAAGFAAHAGDATLDVPVTVAFTAAAVVAALVAGRLGTRTDTARLRRWFAYLVFAVAGTILVQIAATLLT